MPILRYLNWYKNNRLRKEKFHATKCKGFTLLELVVTIGIIATLSGMLISYGSVSRAQLTLMNTEVKLMNILSRAKTMSVSAFLEGDNNVPTGKKLCGYGVHVDTAAQEIFLFRELATDCATTDNIYSGEDEKLNDPQYHILFQTIKANIVASSQTPQLQDVVFIPPDPLIFINNDVKDTEAYVTFETKGTQKLQGTIIVSNVGQISIQR
ncbi:MAG: prepilin-type N-terminal cleavage/methylation domain-containing protein [bacterium]